MRLDRSLLQLAAPFLAAGASYAQTTWFVDVSATPPGNGTPGSPYASIQYAVDQPSTLSGDTLSIAAGTYAERVEQPFSKALTYLAPAGPAATKLSGGMQLGTNIGGQTTLDGIGFTTEQVVIFQSDVLLRDCWLTDFDSQGALAGLYVGLADVTLEDCILANNAGGGLGTLNTDVVLRNVTFANNGPFSRALSVQGGSLLAEGCTFSDNDVFDGAGGAMELSTQGATIRDCTFTDNSAYGTGRRGGAIVQWFDNVLIEGCTFQGNASDQGGAIALAGQVTHMTIVDSTFTGNVAVRDGTGMIPGQGGAIHAAGSATFDAQGCLFQINSAPDSGFGSGPGDQLGGAVFVEGPGSVLSRCTFTDNSADLGGAVLYGPAELEQCVLLQNANAVAGGTVEGGATLDRCTLVHNIPAVGAAAVLGSSVVGSILWDNAVAQLGGGSSATYSCVQGGAAGIGNIAADPLFVDLGNELVDLLQGSPCIDTGAPSAPFDPDLTPADMGALPFDWQPIGASYCSSNPNSSGQTAVMAVLGSASAADDFVRVQATQTAPHQTGLFLMSQSQGFLPFFNGSQGNLCLSGAILRIVGLPDSVGSGGELGVLNTRLQLVNPPYGPSVLPGQTWNFQAWFRDTVAGQQTSNTSDAVSITFQ